MNAGRIHGPWRLPLVAILSAFAAGSPAGAQRDSGAIALDPDSALVEMLRRIEGDPLTLDRAIGLALENATSVRDARAALAAAEGALLTEKGAFDPELFVDVTTASTETPSSSPFARPDVIEDRETTTSAGARILLPIGTEIEASMEARRVDTNSEFTAIDPEYRADGRVEIRQPLLKGFGPGTAGPKAAAGRDRESARAGYRNAELLTRSQVETTYWELYAAERDLAVQRLIVERANALLEQARVRERAGLVGPNEVSNARVFLAEQRLAAFDREERLDSISDALASLLGIRPAGAPRFRPTDEPPNEFRVDPVDALLDRTFQNNAALKAAERSLEALSARATGAGWNALPALDLVGSIGGAGLSGSGREVIFGSDTLRTDVDGGYGDALDQALGRDFPSWSVGVELSFPFPLREGRGERNRLRAEVERARQRVASIRRSLEEEVRASHRELMNSRERLEIAREGVAASLEQVRIGIIEYDNGRTTAFELVRLGADLASAQQRLSEAFVRAARAAAVLQYLTAGLSGPLEREASN
jgi:outer membrane protein TolC